MVHSDGGEPYGTGSTERNAPRTMGKMVADIKGQLDTKHLKKIKLY
jgi:hypothetical protein